ncbi:MAG: WD40 repeat domain-containing protein [Chloroflexi bacterium]|nr:WD40 repeat domain-containing protein [Chloroflexota bacterium]
MPAVTVADSTTLPRILPPVALSIALVFLVLSCDSNDGDGRLDLGAHVQLIESSERVVLEDVSIDRRAILIRVAPELRRDQCGRLLTVDFDGQIEVVADDILMPSTGDVKGNFAAFSPSGQEVAYVSNECQLGTWSLRFWSSGADESETLAGSVSVIWSWPEETKIIFSKVAAGGAMVSLWEANPRTGDLVEITSDPVVSVSPDGSMFVFFDASSGALSTNTNTNSFEGYIIYPDSDGSAFSPDGSEYVYFGLGLAIADLDAGTQRVILPKEELDALLSLTVVEWLPTGRSVLVQGGGDSVAYVIDTDSLEQTRLSLEVPASTMFWHGPLLVYAGGGELWAAISDDFSEPGVDARALSEQIKAGFPAPLDLERD